MPHASLKLIPGVDVNKTPALNETAISQSQLVRFIPDRTLGGLVQKLGGWTKFYANKIGSTIRCLWAWEDTNSNSYLGVGAQGASPIVVTGASGNGTTVTLTYTGPFSFSVNKAITVTGITPSGYNGTYVVTASTNSSVSYSSATTTTYVSGGLIYGGGGALDVITSGGAQDITPEQTTVNTTINFSTTAGSNAVTVVDTGRNTNSYYVVDIQTQISVGGLVLFGQYQVYNPTLSANQYTIYATDALGAVQNATFTTTSVATTGASGTGVTATLTFSGSYVFPVGSEIVVSGVTPTGYNGPYIVAASSAGSVSYTSATTGAQTVAGTISNKGVTALFSTSNGLSTVNVLLANHGYAAGDTFPVLVATSIGGVTFYGNYTITSVIDANNFTIAGSTTATSSTSGYLNGGQVHFVYTNGVGPLPPGFGWGGSGYGLYGYGGVVPSAYRGVPINATDWTLDNWGAILIANPINGGIYYWDPSAANAVANIIVNAPTVNEGIFVAMPQRQIMAWGSTFTGIVDPMLIRWCDVDNFNQWTALVTNQAGSFRIPKGSRIVEGIQAGQQGLFWTDLGVWAAQYVGPPYVYQFNELGNGCGLIGRKAAASMNGVVYWMSQSQFYKLSGGGVEPIRCPIWDVVFQDLDTTNLDRIMVAPNSRFGEISWYFPTYGNSGENYGYVKYNTVLDQWDYGFNSANNPYVARSAWINQSVLGPPIGAGLNQYIYQHETSTDADGVAMDSYFQTGYFVLSDADVKTFIDEVWPDMKWGYYGGSQGANILLTFYVADFPGQTPTTYGPYTLTQATTYITPRFRGRLVSIRIESNDIGSFWRLGNIRYRLQPDGRY